MVMITLYAKQKKRHRCTEQTLGLWGRRRGCDVSKEQHRNMYIICSETDHQPRLDAWDKCLGLVHWEDPEESGGEGGGRGGSGWLIHVTPWLIHVSVWRNLLQYCKVISLHLIKINEIKQTNKKENTGEKPYDHCNRCRNSIWQYSTTTMIKTVRKLGLQTDFLNLIKVIYKTPTANMICRKI